MATALSHSELAQRRRLPPPASSPPANAGSPSAGAAAGVTGGPAHTQRGVTGVKRPAPGANGRHHPAVAAAATDAALGYPEGSTDPKVFVPHKTLRGEIPRHVALKRRRQEYMQYDLPLLLADAGIDYERDGVGGVIPEPSKQGLSTFHSYLPLEAFDDTRYDERSPEDWMALKGDESHGGVPALAVRNDEVERGRWSRCRVTKWDTQEHKLLVHWEERPKQVWLPRLHVLFLAEDPRVHASRIAAAHRIRMETESILRYHLYVDSMPIDEAEPLAEAQLERIRDLSINTHKLLQNEDALDVASVVQEVNTDHSRTLNRILFDVSLHDPAQAELFQGIPMPQEPPKQPAPQHAQVQIPKHKFGDKLKALSISSYIHRQEEVIYSLQKVREECMHILKANLFVPAAQVEQHLPIPLERFAELQHACIDQRCMILREQWSADLRSAIHESLANTTAADEVFLHEKSREEYDRSKLRRMMTTVKFMMQDTLYSLSTKSLETFCEFVEDVCDFDTTVKSLNEVTVVRDPAKRARDKAAKEARIAAGNPTEEDILDEEDGGIERPERAKIVLFRVELQVEQDSFAYSTHTDDFKQTLLAIYDKAVQYQANIPELEPQVMDQFFYQNLPAIAAVGLDDPLVRGWRERVEAAVARSVLPLEEYIKTYDEFLDLVQLDIEQYIKNYREPPGGQAAPSIKDMDKEIQKWQGRRTEVLAKIPETINLGTYLVSCADLRQKLAEKCTTLAGRVMDLIGHIAKGKAENVANEYKKIETDVKMPPSDIQKLVDKKKRFKTIPEETVEINNEIERMREYFSVLEKYQYQLNPEEFDMKWKAIHWPRKLEETIEKEEELLEKDRDRFMEKMTIEQDDFVKEVDQLGRKVAGFYKKTDIKKVAETAAEVRELTRKLDDAKNKAQDFNHRETLFHREKTPYADVYQIIKDFQPYADLWKTSDEWLTAHNSWTNDRFETLDVAFMESHVNNSWKTMTKCVRTFKDKPPLLKIAEQIKGEIEEFRPIMPVVKYLRTPGMKERHWNHMSKELGFDVRPDVTLTTMSDVYNLELQLHQDTIMKVSEVASKEFQIEQQLNDMKGQWESLKFIITPYKETGTYIMSGADEIQQLLDDHGIATQALTFSPFKKQFEEEVEDWEGSLKLVQEILEEWLACQRNWLYLEPIFQSEDISRQLPNEWKRFNGVNICWKDLLGQCYENPFVMDFCRQTQTEKGDSVLTAFKTNNAELEKVQKGLNDYLENKRSSFARFYFLSDDELLTILSEAKNPHNVNRDMRKLFENISRLDMSEDDCEMTAMNSNLGEKVVFKEPVMPRKNIENWLGEVEAMMRKTIRFRIGEALALAEQMPREEFIFAVSGQSAGVVLQAFWTSDCERHFKEDGSLEKYVPTAESNLMALVNTVRNPKLTKLQRTNLSALITVEVHTRDIVCELAENKISNCDEFEWVSQIRAYWENDDCNIKQVEAIFRYGGEYIGGTNMTRLVITPLTDRIYLTLTGAMFMFLGGAPAGPAGTGKTETVKDLAKALAKQCVVFNCQEGMDYISMGKMFKGLANAGAWACFDEFNRIDVEVLSVVAQQVGKLQETMRAGVESGDPSKFRIIFEGSEIVVDPTCSEFITMNPGYAGRTELPDNLKVLFRPVACMVPDYALIGEIRLFSFGYKSARILAQRMVGAFRLSSEQLSSQDHYDFGMRAVNTVISAAGLNKRDYPDEPEDRLLLRALRDSNVPKFLAEDIKLFNGIISDLFPGVELKDADYSDFIAEAKKQCAEAFLQPTERFLAKMIQLTEVTILRHGLMTVGQTMSGKSCATVTLQKVMTALNQAGNPKYSEVWTYICNPKSITMGQLYGQYDLATNEWTDGILCELFRLAANDDRPARKWVIFDGPVDALWIESMNTVLDENKKLCLVSGEIIPMSQYMNVWFEVEDLAVASPATVSRAGMIYMEFDACIGMDALITSWTTQFLPPCFNDVKEQLIDLFKRFMPSAVEFVRKHCKEYVQSVDANLAMSTFRMYQAFLTPFTPTRTYEVPKEVTDSVADVWQPLFFFSLVWGAGGSMDGKSRRGFDKWLRKEMGRDTSLTTSIPEGGTVYQYTFSLEQKRWMQWEETHMPQPLTITGDTNFQEIIIWTADVIRYSWLLGHLLQCDFNTLCVGPTGTGKTTIIAQKLMGGMPEEFVPSFMTFSATTSANQTQDLLFAKFDRRKKKPLIYGAQHNRKMVIFVDDINMPQKEKYFAQPPIELLRQWMDHRGWYDRKTREFYQIIDIMFVAACGEPGGGRQTVTNRFMRHFNFISFPDVDNENMAKIFVSILNSFLQPFPDDVKQRAPQLVDAGIEIYRTICDELLPRPSKPHYTFNLRDIAKVVQGVLSAAPQSVKEGVQLCRLFIHEAQRVFRDRLVDDTDRTWFDELVSKQCQKHFKARYTEVVTSERLLYGDFINPQAETRIYDEIPNIQQLVGVMESYLEDYNENNPSKKMPLVMFLDAIEHVARIARIVRKPGGHALNLGVGGSGRQSLSRLAAFINEYEVFQVEIGKGYDLKAWREDEKKVLRQSAGVGGEVRPTVFVVTDTQIISEQFLEDINNLLNAGEVPNLFEASEMDEINHAMKQVCVQEGLPATRQSLYVRFQRFVKQNLHMSICMSPLGQPFRNRLRMFPALVNCCTIDWFAAWPDQALHSVAGEFFSQVEGLTERDKEQCIQMCVFIHQSVEKISFRFKSELGRHNYVTPTSYLQLLHTIKTVLNEQRGIIMTTKMRMINGLDKLADTEVKVSALQESLKVSQPKLAEAQQLVAALLVRIEEDTKQADEMRAGAMVEETEAQGKAEEVGAIRDNCQAILDKALPALDDALKVLQTLQKKEIGEVGSYPNPPYAVKLTMKGICIMFKQAPQMVGEVGKKQEDYWPKAKQILSNPGKLLDELMNFKRDEIPEKTIDKLEKELISLGDDFTPEMVEKRGSKAAAAMCAWTRAMVSYHHTAKEVAPKKVALAAAEEEQQLVMERLDAARGRLKDVEDKLADLNRTREQKEGEREQLLRDVKNTEVKLERAERLIDGLTGEKINWQKTVERMESKEKTLVGDVLCASGMVSYSGPFTAQFRQELLDQWSHQLDKMDINHSERTSVFFTISDPIAMRQWGIAGLPTDQLSMENAIILHKSRRWPLCIDPQQQANKWIKTMYKDTIEVVKPGAKDMIRRIEQGVRAGRPVLLENVTEEIDASLDPLLLQQKFMQGGTEMIRLSENPIPWNNEFKFFMTTKSKNPHYIPEVQVKVTLLNFFITQSGLEEQLLGHLVAKERADLEALKAQLVTKNAEMRKEIHDIQTTILEKMANVSGDILEDESLIDYLGLSKQKSAEITVALEEAAVAEKEIDEAREGYRPVAFHSSILFFCCSDLSLIDPMYQYSLQWFVQLFGQAIDNAPVPSSDGDEALKERLAGLKQEFTQSFYVNINRSLFEKHKPLFSFLLCIRILQGDDLVDAEEWRYVLSGTSGTPQGAPNPDPSWMTVQMWNDILFVNEHLPNFRGFAANVTENVEHYKHYFMCPEPHKEPLAGEWNDRMNKLQKLIVLRCMRPDKMMFGLQEFVADSIGAFFIKPPPFDLNASYNDSTSVTPLIFVLSQGADPLADFMKLVQSCRMGAKIDLISLGQGQGSKAERLVKEGVEGGRWVLLQNCHLATSWMPTLERLVENTGEGVNPNYRLWLTSMPNPKFPVAILQNGIKMTCEPPRGMPANIGRSLSQWSNEWLAKCKQGREFRKIMFALAFFHAVLQERKKYGPLGWNIPYEFAMGDLNCCVEQAHGFLNKNNHVPWMVIRMLSGEIHYGGRVTDDWDRRYLMTCIKGFTQPAVLEDGFSFSESGIYRSIPVTDIGGYIEHTQEWPLNAAPEMLGLHDNAQITCARSEAYDALETILLTESGGSGGGGGGKSQEDIVIDMAKDILERVREPFNQHDFARKYPTDYLEAMNTVLTQEATRFNKLIRVVRKSLKDLQLAVKGLVVMSTELDMVFQSMFLNQVPDSWAEKAYPSLKPLASWVTDLVQRLLMIENWYEKGKPKVFWISGLYFPQAFLTGTLQNTARKRQVPIDTIAFVYHYRKETLEEITEHPETGCYINGPFIEGARWDQEKGALAESFPKVLFEPMPVIWMECVEDKKKVTDDTPGKYRCPCYKTLKRAGVLSTTGHSTNFVATLEVPSEEPGSHWIKRGVAMFCALNF